MLPRTSTFAAASLWASTFNNVVLPLPDGPISAVSCPDEGQYVRVWPDPVSRTSLGISVDVRENRCWHDITCSVLQIDSDCLPCEAVNIIIGQMGFVDGVSLNVSMRVAEKLHLEQSRVQGTQSGPEMCILLAKAWIQDRNMERRHQADTVELLFVAGKIENRGVCPANNVPTPSLPSHGERRTQHLAAYR